MPTHTPIETDLYLHAAQLSPRSPVRRIAELLLSGRPAPGGSAAVLLEAIEADSPRNWRERLVAGLLLAHIAVDDSEREEAVQTLIPILTDDFPPSPDRVRRGLFGTFLMVGLSIGAALLACWLVLLGMKPPLADAAARIIALALVVLYLLVVPSALAALVFLSNDAVARMFAARDDRTDRLRAAAAHALGRLGDVHATVALAQAAIDSSPVVREAARRSLVNVLALLTEDDFGTLEAATVPGLCRLLRPADDSLTLPVLAALRMIGDGRAIRPVARLAASGSSSRIREAAESLLPMLKERQRQALAPSRLLRPSFAPGLNDDYLLVATQPSTESLPRAVGAD
jgi:HEAT repeat protein